jgi:hypothetical protein
MNCKSIKLPLLLERVGVTTCMDAGGRATQEQLPRRIKSSSYIPLNLLPLEKVQ